MIPKTKVYDIIFWISMGALIVWVVLKIAGVINTPPLLESFPFITLIFVGSMIYQKMILFEKNMARLDKKFDQLNAKVDRGFAATWSELHRVDKRLIAVETKMW